MIYANSIGDVWRREDVDLTDDSQFEKSELNLVKKFAKYYELCDGRFRFEIHAGKIVMITEFKMPASDVEFWMRCYSFAGKIGARIHVTEYKEMDRSSNDDGKTWIEGPLHGVLMRQIEFTTPAAKLKDVPEDKLRVARVTEEAWREGGVNVI